MTADSIEPLRGQAVGADFHNEVDKRARAVSRSISGSRRYGAATPPHMVASAGDGFGPVVDGFGSWSCTSPPRPRAFSSRVVTT